MTSKTDALYEQEAVRDVGARLLTTMEKGDGPGVFLFSSMRKGHGTSTLAAAVSRVLAESGKRTVLAVVESMTAEPTPVGAVRLQEAVEAGGAIDFGEPPLVRLHVPRRYTDLPAAARSPRAWLDGFEVMIIDAPILTEFLTGYWVPQVQGVVLVVDGERASVRAVVQAREDLVRLGGTLIGVVLNRHQSPLPRFLERHFIYG